MKIIQAIRKEFLEIVHDRTMLAVLLVFPVFIMLFMGSSFGSVKISGLPIGVVGPVNTTFSSVLFADLSESDAFNLLNYDSQEEAMESFRNGQLRAIIIVPEDFEKNLLEGDGAEVKIIVDNSDIALQEAVVAAMGSVIQASSTNITQSYVTAAWDDLYSLNSTASGLAKDISKSREQMESTRDSLDEIRQGIGALDIGKLEQTVAGASASIVELEDFIQSDNESLVNESRNFLANASLALNESIGTVSDTHGKLNAQIAELNNTVETLGLSIAALKTAKNTTLDPLTAAALDANIMGLESLQNTSKQQMDDAEVQVAELEHLNATLYSFAAVLGNYSGALDSAEEEREEQVAEISAKLDSLNESFAEVDSSILQLKELFGEINATTNEIDGTLDEVLVQISSVDHLIFSLQETVALQTAKDPNRIAAPLSVNVQNEYLRSSFVDFIIPQVIAVSLLFSCFLLASISLVREKTRKTVVRLLMIPGALANGVVAKIATITLVSLGQVAIILLVAATIFAVKPPENIAALILGTSISALVLSSIGALIGFVARTESAAIQSSLLIAIPMLFLGNIIFSPDLLPVYTQVLQQLLPLAHITNIFKVILITNGDPTADVAALFSYFVLLALVIAVIVFKRRDISNYI